MTPEDWMALGSFLTVTSAAVALIIKQLEQSRCTKLRLCCFECDRKIDQISLDNDHPMIPLETARTTPV